MPATSPRLLGGPGGLTELLVAGTTALFGDLVTGGAALGWLDPLARAEVADLLHEVAARVPAGDAALAVAEDDDGLAGIGWWRRYGRPTYRRNADLERLAVAQRAQGHGLGRALTGLLVNAAKDADVEHLTLDLRGDNAPALGLYRSMGFREHGRLPGFVAVGDLRFDAVLCVLDLTPQVL